MTHAVGHTIEDVESHATEARIKQLASAVSLAASDATLDDYKLRVYEATCEALKIIREESLEGAARKLEAFYDGSILMGGDGRLAGKNAAAMVRGLKGILSRG